MKLFRFMGKDEFIKLTKGEKLQNTKHHTGKTGSIGFCFLPYENDDDIDYSIQFLSGVVDMNVLVVFETDDKIKELYEFFQEINTHGGDCEFKINGKYYKVYMYAEEFSMEPNLCISFKVRL